MGRKRYREDVLQWTTHLQIFEKFLRDYSEAQDKGDVFFGDCVHLPSARPPRSVAFYPLPVHKPDPSDLPYSPPASEFCVESPDYDLLKCPIPVPQILSVAGVIPPPAERLPEAARNVWKAPARGLDSSVPSAAAANQPPPNSEQEYEQVAKMRKGGKSWVEISRRFPNCPLTMYKRRYNQAAKEERNNASKQPARQTSVNSQSSLNSSSATNPTAPRPSAAAPAMNLSPAPPPSGHQGHGAGMNPWLGQVLSGLGVVGTQWPNTEGARSAVPVGNQILAGVTGNPSLAATLAGWPNASAISRLGAAVSTAGGWPQLATSTPGQSSSQSLTATVAAAAAAGPNRATGATALPPGAQRGPQLNLGQNLPASTQATGTATGANQGSLNQGSLNQSTSNQGNINQMNMSRTGGNGPSTQSVGQGGRIGTPPNPQGLKQAPQALQPTQDIIAGIIPAPRSTGQAGTDAVSMGAGSPRAAVQSSGTHVQGSGPAGTAQPPVVTTSQLGLSLSTMEGVSQGRSPSHEQTIRNQPGIQSQAAGDAVNTPVDSHMPQEGTTAAPSTNTKPSTVISNELGPHAAKHTPSSNMYETLTTARAWNPAPGLSLPSYAGQGGDRTHSLDILSSVLAATRRGIGAPHTLGAEAQSAAGVGLQGGRAEGLGQQSGSHFEESRTGEP